MVSTDKLHLRPMIGVILQSELALNLDNASRNHGGHSRCLCQGSNRKKKGKLLIHDERIILVGQIAFYVAVIVTGLAMGAVFL